MLLLKTSEPPAGKFAYLYRTENQLYKTIFKNFQKNLLKKFANTKKSRTFVSGMRKQGSPRGIILLVISFSVINYVVSMSGPRGMRRRLIFFIPVPASFRRRNQ